jgi:hypothetical protein
MPLGKGVRYRWKKYKSGKKVRLAFKGDKVVEVKSGRKGAKAHKLSDKKRKRPKPSHMRNK